MKFIPLIASLMLLQACASSKAVAPAPSALSADDTARLKTVTEQLSPEQQARYQYRHPVETLTFFGIKPGATVVEVLPGEGWYSKILIPYLGAQGRLIGVDYSLDMWPNFGGFATPEFIAKRQQWPEQWQRDAATWGGDDSAAASAYTFTTLPEALTGQVDVVLFIRALHNLARFESQGQYLTRAMAQTRRVLKPGGYVGIVQHALAEDKPDAWAQGNGGYLKRSFLISTMEKEGFEFVAESTVNQNPQDNPGEGDVVWRLPPSLNTDAANKAAMQAIGETNRVTLLFRKKS
jgi:predicted methyltransferase